MSNDSSGWCAKLDGVAYVRIGAKYDSMSEAKLDVHERLLTANYLDSGKMDELLHPANYPARLAKS